MIEALYSEMERRLAEALDGRDQIDWVQNSERPVQGQGWELEVDVPLSRSTSVDGRTARALESEPGGRTRSGGRPGRRSGSVRFAWPPSDQSAGPAAESRPGASSAETEPRLVHFDAGSRRTPVRTRSSIGSSPETGPLLIDAYDTTMIIPPE